ncbi:MAG: ribosome biogenesis GTP-binding protein YsxC [Candidatus Schekmanbacteria bacterium]|nr:ribosome biogenesis GTP-binding protein YsxC [Candidatus Schekmanbacteria bacterium]
MKICEVSELTKVSDHRQKPAGGLTEVAFVGRSNVGKSSLLGALLMRWKLFPTSSTPGKTRTLGFVRVKLASAASRAFHVVDLPGYGFANVPVAVKEQWGRMVEAYFQEGTDLGLVVFIMDVRHPLTASDRELLAWIRPTGVPIQPVLTKADKLSSTAAVESLKAVHADPDLAGFPAPVLFSAKTRQGRNELLHAIWEHVARPPLPAIRHP